MKEASKLLSRWNKDYISQNYLKGKILDIGCGNDKIKPDADGWDKEQGDAQYLETVEDETYDTVFSSHCLEHLLNPHIALQNWWRVLKPAGYLIFTVPDEDLFEQGVFPSVFNPDHKHTFTISKSFTWSPKGLNIIDLIKPLLNHKVISLRTVDTLYDYKITNLPTLTDQTLGPAEAIIECILCKVVKQLRRVPEASKSISCPRCGSPDLVIRRPLPKGIELWCLQCTQVVGLGLKFK